MPAPSKLEESGDLIVGDLTIPFLRMGQWDVSVALNAIDMFDEPASLPELQFELLKAGGTRTAWTR